MSNDACGASGVVTSIKDGFITVRLSSGECASCGCGCRGGNAPVIRLKTAENFSVGDEVALFLPEGAALRHAVLFYGTPVIFMTFAAFAAGFLLKLPEITAASCSLAALLPAWLIVKKLSAWEKYPKVTKLN